MSEIFFVEVNWLREEIKRNKNLVILDIPYHQDKGNPPRLYEDKHLPGAVKINENEISDYNAGFNLYDAETVRAIFLKKGIDSNTTVVVYSDGVIAAGRVAFAAYWLGVKNVKILNGGLHAWDQAGLDFEKGTNLAKTKQSFGLEVPLHSEVLISTPDDLIKEMEEHPKTVLASVRSWKEYVGLESGYSYIKGQGSIPKTTYARASTAHTNVKELVDDEGHFGNLDKIFKEWEKWGITSEKEIVFYCGSGWRASTVFLLAKENGFNHVKVFDGGWYQWNRCHQKNPKKYPIQIGNSP